jgi:ABC-type multidrug transport system ATPase subunit
MFIMGSSGAGKTSLLNILCDQVSMSKGTKLEGQVLLNDEIKVTHNNFGSYAAYVTQDDYLFESFTCEKCIEFAAKLRLNLPNDQIKKRVDDIINRLSLHKCRKTIVGNLQMKGLSGGEKKRTSIAVELVTNPKILFLDEPTSGLDSFNAQKLVKLLVDFASQGKTVISTIHQPNSDTFKIFPKFLLMMDGHTIYQGKTMASVDYFNRIGYCVPEYSNPSDYYLREFYVPFVKTEKDNEKLITVVSTYETQIHPQIKAETEELRYEQVTEKQLLKNMTKAGWCKEFFLLFYRCIYNILFHPMIIKFKTIVIIVLAGACLSLFWDPGNDREGVRGKIGASFFITALFIYGPVGETLQSFSAERPVFLKEYSNKTYGLWSYSLSKSLVEMPFEAFYVILFSSIVYFSMGLQNTFENFAIF